MESVVIATDVWYSNCEPHSCKHCKRLLLEIETSSMSNFDIPLQIPHTPDEEKEALSDDCPLFKLFDAARALISDFSIDITPNRVILDRSGDQIRYPLSVHASAGEISQSLTYLTLI